MAKLHRSEFVISNEDIDTPPEVNANDIGTKIRYLVMKLELSTGGFNHYQGYVEYTPAIKGLRSNQLADLLGVEGKRLKYAEYSRDRDEARAYVMKPETALEPYKEWGTWIQNTKGGRPAGSTKKQKTSYDDALSEASSQRLDMSRLRELKADNPTRSRHIDEAINERLTETAGEKPRIHWFYCVDIADLDEVDAYALKFAEELAGDDKNIYQGKEYSLNDHRFTDYVGEEIVVLDSLTPERDPRNIDRTSAFLTKMLTRPNGYSVDCGNFTHRPFVPTDIIIATIGKVKEFYEHSRKATKQEDALTTYAVWDDVKNTMHFMKPLPEPAPEPEQKRPPLKRPQSRLLGKIPEQEQHTETTDRVALWVEAQAKQADRSEIKKNLIREILKD